MRRKIFVFALIVISSTLLSQSPPVPGEWEITFEDEFDLDHVDETKWRQGQNVCHFNGAASNGNDNIIVEDGKVKLVAEKRQNIFSGRQYEYASGELTSFRCFRQLYGYLETRVKYDAVRGSWPAVWFMPDQGKRGSEDIMRQAFMKFDLGGITGPVSSAILEFKVKSLSSNDCGFTVHRLLSDDWSEGNLTWNNRPESDPVWVDEFTGTTNTSRVDQINAGSTFSIDVTEEINLAIDMGIDPGFVLKDIFMRQAEIQFYSKETSDAADRPVLDVDGTEFFPSDDAFVRAGQYADANYGDNEFISTMDPWASTSSTYNGGMEMDILETLGIWGDNYNQHALHWDGYGDDHQHAGSGKIALEATADGYHTYGVFWKPGKVEFYTDGKKTWEYSSSRVGSVSAYILLSHQLGGWDGNGDIDDAAFPATVSIDYVRMYKNLKGADVKITSPEGGSIHGTGNPVEVQANVTEWGGSVAAVDFYMDDVLLVHDTEAPYEIAPDDLDRGEHRVVAKVLDAEDKALHSDTLNFVVADPPQVSLAAPDDGTKYTVPVDLDMEASVSSSGEISEVAFFLNNKLVFTDTEPPYSYIIADIFPGSYYLKAEATDELGLSAISDSILLEVEGLAMPDPWIFIGVGNPETEGSGTYYKDMFYLEGSGYDPEGRAEKMHFVYQGLSGNGEIIAELFNIEGTNSGAKAGLMMRENLFPGSKAAGVLISMENDGQLLFRNTEDAQATRIKFIPAKDAPLWLRLTREENVFKAYSSSDGADWQQVMNLSMNIEMGESCLAGLYISSAEDSELAQTNMGNVVLTGDGYQDQMPTVSISAPSGDTLYGSELLIQSEVSDPDGGQIQQVEYYADDELIGVVDTLPFSFLWEDVAEGNYIISAKCTDNEGNIAVSETVSFVLLPVGINNATTEKARIIIGPVPSDGLFSIEVSGISNFRKGNLQVLDLRGRIIEELIMNNPVRTVDLRHLAEGMYYLRFSSEEIGMIQSLMIQK